jgi:hypothetical protein
MLTSMSLWHRVQGIAWVLAIVPFLSAPARAADESGWFDTPSTAVPAAPVAPVADEAPAPPQPPPAEMPSLPPSPLLEDSRASAPAENVQTDADPRALSDFRPSLDPYGYWVNHPTYGTVWVPNRDVVGEGFAPYVSSGRWALDDSGQWIWVSDYPFGRVVLVTETGWAWVPGYRYAPAWVSWRVPTGSYAYVGWAPLGPDYVWFNGVAVSYGYGSPVPWVFCPSVYVFHRHVHHYVVRDRGLVTRIAAHTRRYAPAAPRARGNFRTAAYVSGPSLASARVPAHAVPRERVRAVPARPPGAALPGRVATRPGFVGGAGPSDRGLSTSRRSVAPRAPGATLLPAPRGPQIARPERRISGPEAVRPRERVRRAEAVRRPEPVRTVEPSRPEPVRRAEPVRPIEPVRRAEPIRRMEPRAVEPMRRIGPAAPRGGGGSAFPRRALPRSRP